jgi:hypothetical protein
MNHYPVHLSAAALDNTRAPFHARTTTAFQANRPLPLKDDDEAALWVPPDYPSRAPATLADASAALLNC